MTVKAFCRKQEREVRAEGNRKRSTFDVFVVVVIVVVVVCYCKVVSRFRNEED